VRTSTRILLGITTLVTVGCIFTVPPVYARIVAQKLPFTLGPIGEPNAIAVDQVHGGSVFVTDHATNTVKVFSDEGGPSTTEITGTPTESFNFGSGEEPAGVAIDNSGGADAGDLYVADTKHHVVDKFKLEGGRYAYVCQFRGFGGSGNECSSGATPSELFGEVGGVAVDSHGDVYVSTFSPHMVYEFNATGEDERVAEMPSEGGEPSGLAVSSKGVVYVQEFVGLVFQLTPKGSKEFEIKEFPKGAPGEAYAVAVDSSTGEVFVDHLEYIDVYSEEGALLANLLAGERRSEGVGINDENGDLYVSNEDSRSIESFHPVKVPDVKLTGHSAVEPFSVTVKGEIEPEGTSEAKYYFEYGSRRTLGFTTPIKSVAPVNEYIPVEGHLENLEPNTEYGYILVGTNSTGLEEKTSEETVTTKPHAPEVAGTQADEVTPTDAAFSGEVNPENTLPTKYHFEYEPEGCGKREACLTVLPAISIGASGKLVPVAQPIAENTKLTPATKYELRLVAENPSGEVSEAKTFTTPAEATLPGGPPSAVTGPAEAVALNSATLTGEVDPNGLPTLYEFEFFEAGASGLYTTVIFGGEAGSGPVTPQVIGNLLPGVTYDYRVTAFNAAGSADGGVRAFSTPNPPAGAAQPPTPALLVTPVFQEPKYPLEKKKPGKKTKKHHKKPKRHGHGKVKKAKRK
jgi:hypothetical protein